jgi:rhodanese-related sulfurtransferase
MTPPVSPEIRDLTPAEVAGMLQDRQILLVDVREPQEYAAQRIPGALLCPLSTFDAHSLPAESAVRVVFQCGSGKRSAMAARARLLAGAPSAAHLAGGIGAWTAAGLATIEGNTQNPK